MDNSILVSCMIACYNSAKTIVETLESIKSQTYGRIELIVSDDCSTDDSVEIVKDWMNNNRSRFERVELLTVDKNTGVCGNCNRAIAACQGLWIKGIAGDDILLPNCVSDFVEFVEGHPEAMWVSSQIRIYQNTFDEENCLVREYVMDRSFFDFDVSEQLRIMARRDVVYAPAIFFKKELWEKVGGYDETLAFEDHSFCMDALEHGHKCYLLEKEAACYRMHSSMCRSGDVLFIYKFLLSVRPFYKERCFKYLSRKQIFGIRLQWGVEDLIVRLGMNSNKHKIIAFLYKRMCGAIFHIFG